MFCPKCGNKLEQTAKYCTNCGNCVDNNISQVQNVNTSIPNNNQNNLYQNTNNQFYNYPNNNYKDSNIDNKKSFLVGIGIGVGVLLVIFICFLVINNNKGDYYFSDNTYEEQDNIVENVNNSNNSNSSSTKKKSKYQTIIITDNTYSGVNISSDNDAYNLISKDSVSQKSNCPSEIRKIEEEIISKYNVTAVNLCEMDLGFAKELVNVFEKVYNEYPSAREDLTNLSLVNASLSEGYIAAFMPTFPFATADTSSTYPWVFKTQVLLNTTYFLNPERLESSVTSGSDVGHFPPNATIYSPVAHELGHYLSFLAMMRHYETESILLVDNSNIKTFYELIEDFRDGDFSLLMITEAYENYKKDTNINMPIDEWRATISSYAVAKDNSGEYIYDETIAEAFHDVYLNGDNAKDASKYVVSVLKEKLEG